MATKKDLEARLEALEAEIALLRVQVAQKQPGITMPQPSYPYPNDWYPFGWPKIWCGTGSISNSGTQPVTFNASAA